MKYQLDRIDQRILSFLVKNARMPFLEIARECGVSGAAIHQRVKKMENMGIITGSRLLVKPQALGLNVCAFVGVSLSETNKYNEVIKALKQIPEVVECHFVTGKHALLIKLYCTDHDHLMRILVHEHPLHPEYGYDDLPGPGHRASDLGRRCPRQGLTPEVVRHLHGRHVSF